MTVLEAGITLIRQWFREPVPDARGRDGALAIDLEGTLEIARADDDRIEASIAGRIRVVREGSGAVRVAESDEGHHGPGLEPDPARAETRVDARCRSVGALADAHPFVWLQLLDDRGAALTHETLLGRGVAIEHRVHARIVVPAWFEPPMADESDDREASPRRTPARVRLVSGLHARVVARTYRNASGPRYHEEVLMLTLLAAGDILVPALPMTPVLAVVPARPPLPERFAPAEAGPV